jgi:hypothetical protein
MNVIDMTGIRGHLHLDLESFVVVMAFRTIAVKVQCPTTRWKRLIVIVAMRRRRMGPVLLGNRYRAGDGALSNVLWIEWHGRMCICHDDGYQLDAGGTANLPRPLNWLNLDSSVGAGEGVSIDSPRSRLYKANVKCYSLALKGTRKADARWVDQARGRLVVSSPRSDGVS